MESIHKAFRIIWQPMVGIGLTLLTQGYMKNKIDWLVYGGLLVGIPAIYYLLQRGNSQTKTSQIASAEFEETEEKQKELNS